MPALRLSHKLFLAFALLTGVVLSLAGWSLLTTRRLTAENRGIIERVLPAVRLEIHVLEGIAALRRVEARHALLRDPAYLRLFAERAQALESDLGALGELVSTVDERLALGSAADQLRGYRALVERPARDDRDGEQAATRLETAAQRLYAHSSAELRRRGHEAGRLEERSRLVALFAIVASVAVSLGIGGFASVRIAQPLRELRAAAWDVERRRAIAAIPVRGRDEIADLTIAFNRMADRLRELDTLKQDLFSAITHDLRTPLTVIAWSAERLKRGEAGMPRDRQASLVENIRMNTARLLSLVTQILDLGKLRTGKLQLDLQPTDLHALIEGAVDEIRPWAEDRGLHLDVTVAGAIPKLLLDEKRIHQVLVNLLANAVKYSKAAGIVALGAELADDHVVVKVADTGIGIPAALRATVFERYEQAHSGRDGTGLGLAVVKAFVVAHGGQVWVESEEGVGSCFGFTLPLEAPNP
jgi:signal transduction histidine kinase